MQSIKQNIQQNLTLQNINELNQKKKLLFNTQSYQSINTQNNYHQLTNQTLNIQLTHIHNIDNYTNFFIQSLSNTNNQSNNYYQNIQLLSFYKQLSTINKGQINQSLNNNLNQQNISIISNINSNINLNTYKYISKYQSEYLQSLQLTLLKSKKFKKIQSFTQNIIIHNVYPSKNYEIVKLEIQLLSYKTQIIILNSLKPSILLNTGEISASGTFGYVFFVNTLNEQIAIKCTILNQFDKNKSKSQIQSKTFIAAIKEYFFLLLFSQLQIGPKAKKIGGFDMILHSDCIQFASQICSKPFQTQNSNEVSKSLFKLHMLQIVHRDIKPSNIMYSPTFKKDVFIDFGITEVLNKKLGHKSLTKFMGTTIYCSDQVLQLLNVKQGCVDLYYNDVFGLQKSLNQLIQPNKIINDQIKINNFSIPVFQIIGIKFSLYTQDFDQFLHIWQVVKTKYLDHLEQIELQLINFFFELKPSLQLRRFYWTQIDEDIRDMNQFKQLNKIFRNLSFEYLFKFSNNHQKQIKFDHIVYLYKALFINNAKYSERQKQIELILASKQNIKKFLIQFKIQYKQNNKQQANILREKIKQQLQQFCIIVIHYSSLSSNIYKNTIEQKIQTCKFALQILWIYFSDEIRNSPIIFQCNIQELSSIFVFYQFYLLQILNNISIKNRLKIMPNIILTLTLLGYPLISSKASQILLKNFISDEIRIKLYAEQIINNIENTYNLIFFRDIYYNQPFIKQAIQNKFSNQYIKQALLYRFQIMSLKQNQQNKLIQLSSQFYNLILIEQSNKFNLQRFNQLYALFMSSNIIQLTQSSIKNKQLWLLIFLFLQIFTIAKFSNQTNKLQSKILYGMISFKSSENNILTFIKYHYLLGTKKDINQSLFFDKLDQIINYYQLSVRFQLHARLKVALTTKNYDQINKIKQFLQNQIKIHNYLFEMNSINLIQSILGTINFYLFNNYFKQVPTFTHQSIQILQNLQPIVIFCMNLGGQFLTNTNFIKQIYQIQIEKFSQNKIRQLLNTSMQIKQFCGDLIDIGKIYSQSVSLIKKTIFNKQVKFQFQKDYFQIVSFIKQHSELLNYIPRWLNSINQSISLKQFFIKYNELRNEFLTIYLSQFNRPENVVKCIQVMDDLCQNITIQKYQDERMIKLDTDYKVAFCYFQLRIMQTNFNSNYCDKFIRLYKVCQKNNE